MEGKLYNFFSQMNLVKETEWENFYNSTKILIKKNKDKKIVIKINFIKMLAPDFLFSFLKRIKIIDDSIIFGISYDIDPTQIDVVFDYLMYFSEQNFKEENGFLHSILIRKRGSIENNVLTIFYMNPNEQHILQKRIKMFENFLNDYGWKNIQINLSIDENVQELNLIKKSHENRLNEISRKLKENKLDKNVNKYKFTKSIVGDVVRIKDLMVEMEKAIIEGEIFKIDVINTKKGMDIYKIYVTDYTDSIVMKMIARDAKDKEFVQTLKKGSWLKASVNLNVDMYENNDLTCIAKDVTLIAKPEKFERKDNSTEKRIEFINHSKMTAFEGLIDAKDLFAKAKKFGHTAISITDKFNCQSFPDIYNESKKNPDIKVIYGTQFNKTSKNITIVQNPIDIELRKGTYVLFDLETTGLSPYYDKIIEFGAIKYCNGQIVDSIQFFIDPEQVITHKIFSITKISNSDVEGAIKIKEALIKIKEFFGDAILIAHNGIKFDLPFINCKLEQNNMPIITNPLIDTMFVSRSLNEQISGHSLGAICRKFKIDYNDEKAHRADQDAEYLLGIWKKFMNILETKNITNLLDLNVQLQNKLLLSRTRGSLISVYCKKQESIKSLYKLISKSLTDNYADGAKIFMEDTEENRDHFLISNSPTEGDVFEYAMSNTDKELEKLIKNNYDFITISPVTCFKHEIEREVYKEEWLQDATKRIIEYSKKYNKLVIASSDSYYMEPTEIDYFKVYVYAKSIGGKRHRFYKYNEKNISIPELHFRTTDEMIKEFVFLKNKELIYDIVIRNTNKIAELIEKGIKPIKESLHSPFIEGASDSLKKLIYQRSYDIFGMDMHEFVKERINREINSVIDNGYSIVYWFSHLLVKKSVDDGFVVGSRGSVGSSIAAWLANISEVNPLPSHYLCKNCKYFEFVENCSSGFDLDEINCPKCNSAISGDGHNVPFETFMGFEGDKIPDIDLNFSAVYQSKAHDFIKEMFGKERVFRAGTIGTVAEKTAYGYVKAYFEEIEKPHVKNAEIYRLASKCENVKRTTGQHPGGIIVIPYENDVYDFTPFNYPADDTSIDWFTTHFAFESLHDSLLKFDILGHDNPTVLKMLTEQTGIKPENIPNHDKEVMDLFNSTDSLKINDQEILSILKIGSSGIPEFGTNFVKEMLLVTRPKKFSDLIRISGLSHGTLVWNDNAKDLIEKQGLEISDVISCRDDIMVYLMNKGVPSKTSFKIMEDVRKGKGLKEEYINELKANDVPEWYINSCQKIQYLFPKAHATAYVIMAWKIAWFKIHYPLSFYASFFSIRTDVFDIKTIVEGKFSILEKLRSIKSRLNDPKLKSTVKTKEIDLIQIYEITLEMIGRGYSIGNIDINRSDATNFIVEKGYLIPPFTTIDGLGEAVAMSIVEARKERPFASKEDLKSRTKITNTHFKILDELKIISHLEDDDQLTLFK